MPTFPVDLKDYLGGCARVEQQTFDLAQGLQVQNQTAGGEVLRSGGATRLWRGTVTLYAQRYGNARALHAKLHVLAGQGATFLVNDAMHDGISFTAEINGVNADGRVSLRAAGANRVLRAGDYIGFTYAGRRALHQVVEPANANASGVTGAFDVVPPIRPGWAVGAAVTAGAARCVAVMVPGSLRVGASGPTATSGASFDWIQTLRQVT